ncbi:Transmembrane and coiled-coil domain-containing protein 4 [Galemys pyrenaicus]|uniref:Transmembrane and coiled-coil domain-containing protein 4 n=1 Tax=Galemys pyrenaicus TaxID=202257 RepID=A0A8J5ZJQ3_GALPY|nr:Transmembrane and coiled-coil domain-containing protein 4 [Galemys pyrenaicus]
MSRQAEPERRPAASCRQHPGAARAGWGPQIASRARKPRWRRKSRRRGRAARQRDRPGPARGGRAGRGRAGGVASVAAASRLDMATEAGSSQTLLQGAGPVMEGEPQGPTCRDMVEANRFAYAALCGISLSQLFPEPEESSFCTEFVAGLVKWLDLSESVLPTMTAFASGLGGEGADVFVQILLKDPILKEDPMVITQDLLSFSLKDGHYDARARVLLCHVSSLLRVPLEELDVLEEMFLESLKETKEEESEHVAPALGFESQAALLGISAVKPSKEPELPSQKGLMAEASRKKKENRRKWKRYLLIGLATVGGGTVIAGAATIIGSAGAAALGSAAGIAIMTSLFGAAGAGLTGYKMKKRVGAIEEFTFLPLSEGRQLHITIAITGWLASGKYRTFSAPWAPLARSREQYCLAWEAKYLMELGNALETILSGLANMVAQEALKYTVLSGIVAALTWPASLLAVANVIDNPWGVCLHRSAEVGKHLAHLLLSRQQTPAYFLPQGRRPVSLIGFSLGARVIYFCLQEMAQEKVMHAHAHAHARTRGTQRLDTAAIEVRCTHLRMPTQARVLDLRCFTRRKAVAIGTDLDKFQQTRSALRLKDVPHELLRRRDIGFFRWSSEARTHAAVVGAAVPVPGPAWHAELCLAMPAPEVALVSGAADSSLPSAQTTRLVESSAPPPGYRLPGSKSEMRTLCHRAPSAGASGARRSPAAKGVLKLLLAWTLSPGIDARTEDRETGSG